MHSLSHSSAREDIPLVVRGRSRANSDVGAYGLRHSKHRRFVSSPLLRAVSENLHRTESMVSLCFRSLVNYITDDNLAGLKIFLENKRVQIDDRDENNNTALIVAASKGKLYFVRELINHGADANAEDADNWSALLCAAKEGYADICMELLEHGADIEHRDMGGWTALMWATYKGHSEAAALLLDRGSEVNAHGNYHISSLLWAAGRGHVDIARNLIHHGAKVNVGDKYGTTALVWACRKGNVDIVDSLLKAGANVDTAGMYSWTPLLVATLGNHVDVVNRLLEHKPNVNALDKDGCTALTLACKEGFHEIAVALLNVGAYINIQDRAGDTNLIHAVKGGHRGVVEALLKKYADVDISGKDRKTAIYWAVEKGNVAMVKLLLSANPDLEMSTKDGDTPLLRAVRIRNVEIVQLLLDKKAKVSANDKKGDTALHIAMRARSKGIVEVLLRNPKNSQLLYRPNRSGETPYNIDMNHQKTILGQIFGARRLNTNEDNENMLGYDLYSSALADILSEPSLSMPITVGLYAKWGSGKSFLLNKLREEMKNFARQWVDPVFQFSSLLLLVIVHTALLAGMVIGLAVRSWIIGVCSGGGLVLFCYTFLILVWYGSQRYDWYWPYNFHVYVTRKLNSLKLILQVMFCHPPGANWNDGLAAQPIRFYFTDQTRVSSTTGGENSVVQMLGSLYDSIENDYGAFATRLYRAFRPKSVKSTSSWRWRRLCCLPYVIIFEIGFLSFLAGICVLTLYLLTYETDPTSETAILERTTAQVILITIGLLLCVGIVANLYTWAQMLQALVFSQRRHLQRAISHLDTLKSEGFLQALRSEVNLMTEMAKCLDSFTTQQTRLVVIVDGLDSCEQDKVLLVLDAVHMLFSDTTSPFIVILAIDPHVISKAVEVNSRRLFNESNIGGHDYLRNMVHLPFYLQNSGLRKVKVAQQTAQHHRKSNATATASSWNENEESVNLAATSAFSTVSGRRLSSESGLSSSEKLKPASRKGSRKLKLSESIASSLGSNLNRVGGAHDLTKMLLTDDYFSDVNPRSMRRLMNVVYITGRLLKSFQIDFNWYHLASWVNITEQWPFRTSWIILYYDMYEDTFDDNTSLKTMYDKVRPQIPVLKDVEPLLELDRDERKFDIFLTYHRNSLLVSDLKIFLPFTINLDPYIKKVIKEEQQSSDEAAGLIMSSQFAASPPPAPAMVPPPSQTWGTSSSSSPWSGHKSSLTRRQRPLSRSSSVQGPNMLYSQHSMVGWPQAWMSMQDPMGGLTRQQSTIYPPLSAVTCLPPDVLETKLSTLNVDGVSNLLTKVDDMSSSFLPSYTSVIHENNINGRVLLHCDLDELKKVLQMNFGDWELFRMLVVSLREQELAVVTHQEELGSKNVRFADPSRQVTLQAPERKGINPKTSGQLEKEKSSSRGDARSTNKQTIMEKQVTLEEQMICGALQTLNEEACEDVMEETEEEVATPYKVTSLAPPSELDLQTSSCVQPANQSSSVVDTLGETEVVLLQSSPHHPYWQPVTINIGSGSHDSNIDCCPSADGSASATPIQQRKQQMEEQSLSGKPPLPPTKLESAAGTNRDSLHSLLQHTSSTRSITSSQSIGCSSALPKPKQHQRPSSLFVLGDDLNMEHITPPSSPKHHSAFRSRSADDGRNNSKPLPVASTSIITNLTSSLRAKMSNGSLIEGATGSPSVSPSFLITPTSSLEKLNRLKDRIMRTVTAPGGNISSSSGVVSGEGHVDIDSDDESTPLVSEISTPAASSGLNALASEFLNRGFSVVGGYSSHSGSSDDSPSSVKTTPISPPKVILQQQQEQEMKEQLPSEADNGNLDVLINSPFMRDDNNIAALENYASSSCGSSVSLSQVLEPASNYYHLVTVSDSISSVEVDSQFSSHEQLNDSDLRLSSSKMMLSSSCHLSRQDALDRSGGGSCGDSKDHQDEWSNPETTV
ncbi:kinase D-interacting substrate of 220 kDa isoform X3 [Zootermopsis nevadensis]|uniref:kinase D-interacting substrate of 220 kDa isoform X3 n=1 Tax=Zootermopsis nevadensis TaxID=136037 RepID=UPI000B8EDA25|nr:kinase D-interacting substrate of 220 kDa isoform X3 [Zootermopsis nevadensis]